MIAYLEGIILKIYHDSLVLSVNGVGYLVYININDYFIIGNKLSIYVETIIKENAIYLIGFINEDEQNCFKLLVSVSGVGYKSALSILSIIDPSTIYNAIKINDPKALQMADGIGYKIACRIITELSDKVKKMVLKDYNQNNSLVIEALLSLGYDKKTTLDAIKAVMHDDDSINTIITKALQYINK